MIIPEWEISELSFTEGQESCVILVKNVITATLQAAFSERNLQIPFPHTRTCKCTEQEKGRVIIVEDFNYLGTGRDYIKWRK